MTRDQFLIYLSTLLWGFGLSLFMYIQPLYIAQLGASPAQIGLVLGLSGLIVPLLYIPLGLWADRRGRRPLIRAGWGLGALATFAIAAAPDWRWLIPGLTAYQLSNFALPAFYGYVAASTPRDQLNRVFAIITSSFAIGSIIAPALGGWIGQAVGLRAVYFWAAVAFTLSTLAIWPITHQPVEARTHQTNARLLWSNRPFLWQIGFIFLLFFAIELGQVMAPKFLEDVRGLTISQIGWLGTIGSLGVMLLSLTLGQMPSERRGSLVLSQVVALLALILLLSTSAFVFIGLAYFIHGSNRLVRPIVDARLAHSLTPATLSFGYGFRELAMRSGLAAAPYLAGLLYTYDPFWPLVAGIVGLTLTLLLTFTLPADLRAHAPRVTA
jgi:DHA1 family multidrug resistance protein-like MFS transporter